jgi:site-specific recombinase XerD
VPVIACYFIKWCKERYGCRMLFECRQYVDEWLTERSVLAPHSQKLEACALAKVFDCTTEDFIKTAVRHRSGITRSRKAAKRDKNFSETKDKEFIEFCKATGLRKKELKCLRGTQLVYKNGIYYIAVTSGAKGGRYREVLQGCRTFKSSHCIRRTFASRLYAEGMSLEEISVYIGHEDTDTTKGYIYNYNEIEKNRAYMDKAL